MGVCPSCFRWADGQCLCCNGTGLIPALWVQDPDAVTNADLGFGPGDDDEQESYQWFLTTGRIIA